MGGTISLMTEGFMIGVTIPPMAEGFLGSGDGTEDGSENGSGSRLGGHYFPEYRALFAGVV